jgi:hypothetical protein
VSFEAELDSAINLSMHSFEEVYIKAASKLAEIIVDATPEDTGALKGAWTPNIGSPVFRSDDNSRLDLGGEQTKSEIREVFSEWSATEGDLFGEQAAVTRAAREFTAVAATDCLVLEIRWQGLKRAAAPPCRPMCSDKRQSPCRRRRQGP